MRTVLLLIVAAVAATASDSDQQTAHIGDLALENGGSIQDCVVGYRTVGTLNAAKSNAVLFPTWFSGRSQNRSSLIGPGKAIDSSRFYVITVDALGDGISSSSSTSPSQPRLKFPQFTIRDMVESQHRLLTGKLGIQHLHAVIGISMGGMQTFQWLIAYPDFMDRAIPIVGSPQLTSMDLLLWSAELHTIQAGNDWMNGDYAAPPVETMRAVSDLHQFALSTPDKRVADLSRTGFPKFLNESEASTLAAFDANDWMRQLEAMLAHDIARPFGGSLERAAEVVRAKVLVVAARQDHMVNPHPALAFATLIHAETLILEGDCGHLAPDCEAAKVTSAVSRFLR